MVADLIMKTVFKAALTSFAADLIGCASHTQIPSHVRTAIEQFHNGRVMELRQSCYYGDLYDDTDKWLLSAHAFDSVHHIVDFDGKPIHPTGQRGSSRLVLAFDRKNRVSGYICPHHQDAHQSPLSYLGLP